MIARCNKDSRTDLNDSRGKIHTTCHSFRTGKMEISNLAKLKYFSLTITKIVMKNKGWKIDNTQIFSFPDAKEKNYFFQLISKRAEKKVSKTRVQPRI
jgi:hypothetical protein